MGGHMPIGYGGKPERVYLTGFNIKKDDVEGVAREIRELILDSEAGNGNALTEPTKETLFKLYEALKAA